MAAIFDRLKGAVGGFMNPPNTVQPKAYGKPVKLSPDKAQEFIGDLDLKIKAGVSAHAPKKQKMYEADKYWQGEHWDDDAPPWMPKPMENWVLATVEQHSANLGTANIIPIIYEQDPGDSETARKFDLAIQHLWTPAKLNGRRVVRRSIHTAMKYGTALVKVYFDLNINGGKMLPSTQMMTNPLDKSTYPVSHTLYKGEVQYEMVDPSNVISDPSGYTLCGPGACEWVCIRTPRTLDWIVNYPMFQEYLGKSQLKGLIDNMELNGDLASTEFYLNRTANTNHPGSKRPMLDEVWTRNMDEFGNYHINLVYKIGDVLLYYAQDVFKDGEFPFAILYDYEVEKSFFGMGEPEQVIPSQNTINQVTRLIAHNGMMMSNSQKEVLTDSGIDTNKVAETGSMPGAVYLSRVKDGIQNLKVEDIPVSMFKIAEAAREGIRSTMAMDEANMGQFGGSVTAAAGIKMIQDKANVRDQDKGMNVEDFVSRLTYLTISRMQQYYTEERYIPITGEAGKPIGFFPFKGSDYGDVTLVIHIEAGSGTPLNKVTIYQRAWEMFKEQGVQKYDPPLITAEELIETMDGFPMKERMKRRIREQIQAMAAAPPPVAQESMPPQG